MPDLMDLVTKTLQKNSEVLNSEPQHSSQAVTYAGEGERVSEQHMIPETPRRLVADRTPASAQSPAESKDKVSLS